MGKGAKIATNIILAIILFAVAFLSGAIANYFSMSEKERTINWLVKTIEDNFVYYDEETGELVEFSTEDYADAIVEALLDEYSAFYTAQEVTNEIITDQGNYYGTGLAFWRDTVDLEIARVSGNSPAEKAGMERGEVITAVEIDGQKTEVNTYEELVEVFMPIKGEVPFKIYTVKGLDERVYTLSKQVYIESYIWYYDSEKQYTFESNYGEKPLGVEANATKNFNLPVDTAYIVFTAFNGAADYQMAEALEYMRARGKTNLILDLRNNGGGQVDIFESLASYLVKGDLKRNFLGVAKYKNGKEENFYTTHNAYQDVNIVILANENTASASEMLIGAMVSSGSFSLDNLVCTKTKNGCSTYGKGIMQSGYVNIFTGEGAYLTSAYIYWPNGVTIHGKGISPTIEENKVEDISFDVDEELIRAIEIIK